MTHFTSEDINNLVSWDIAREHIKTRIYMNAFQTLDGYLYPSYKLQCFASSPWHMIYVSFCFTTALISMMLSRFVFPVMNHFAAFLLWYIILYVYFSACETAFSPFSKRTEQHKAKKKERNRGHLLVSGELPHLQGCRQRPDNSIRHSLYTNRRLHAHPHTARAPNPTFE